MSGEQPVVEGLRRTLAGSRNSTAFVQEMEGRIRQLLANMVDGRVLPKPEADAVRTAMVELVRAEALPKFVGRNPNDAIRILDKLKEYGYAELEGERGRLEAARAAKFPPPAAPGWPVLEELRGASAAPDACTIGPPVQSIYFAKELEEDGLQLPAELLALYAWADGFDLSCLVATHLPVFSFLSCGSIEVSPEEDGYPRRAAVFQGGDEIQFSVYRDPKKQWWLVYEYDYQPVAKKLLDLPDLIRFGLRRMNAPSDESLGDDLSWERFFEVADR